MLEIPIPKGKVFNNDTQMFYDVRPCTLNMEHSLISVSKWEAKWHKSFLSAKDKTVEMTIDYIRCMTISKNIDPIVYYALTPEDISKINAYIEDPMTATTFNEPKRPPSRKIVTSEQIYYWMFCYSIPKECEQWHLNRLLTLIHIFELESQPKKKMSRSAILKQNAALNDARLAKLRTRG